MLMTALITSGKWQIDHSENYSILDFVRLKTEEETQARKRSLPKKQIVQEKKIDIPRISKAAASKQNIRLPDLNIETPKLNNYKVQSSLFLGGFSKSEIQNLSDGDVLPLVRIAPQYPRRAAIRGIEGWVKLKFTITEDGSVVSPEVLDSKPSRTFDRAAMNAIKKWKFKPRLINGKAVSRQAEQIIEFKLSK